ncbi:MAG: phage holin family protein [Oscillospiraceae bacterium]
MDILKNIKIGITTICTLLTAALGQIAIPFYFLIIANIMDYATGITAAKYRNEKVNSYKGFRGIAKKVCMWLLVAVGAIMDYAIINMGATMGIEFNLKCIVALAVIFWLLLNEFISILENMADIGAPIPPFLLKLIKTAKDKTEETMDIESAVK